MKLIVLQKSPDFLPAFQKHRNDIDPDLLSELGGQTKTE
jgi:hypothetical protein